MFGRPARLCCLLLQLIVLAIQLAPAQGNDRNHKYASEERVKIWVNKVGPYNNPQETYNYYHLPFCRAAADPPFSRAERKWGGLGEVLQGNQLINSNIPLIFRQDVVNGTICSKGRIKEFELEQFTAAVQSRYWLEWYVDDLPVWGYVGQASPPSIFTHRHFDIAYNGNRIIQVNMTGEAPQSLTNTEELHFTYSVTWTETAIPFSKRYDKYLDASFFQHRVHWFSVLNSFMLVLFLVGVVAVILMRTLRRDYARYAREEEDLESLERDMCEEVGWKLVHGDVFRPPGRLSLLCALVGTGAQLSLMALSVICITIATHLFEERGSIATVLIICYSLTSLYSGYVSGGMYSRHEGRAWIHTMLLTASLLPGCVIAVACVVNTLAICYHSLAAVPFGSIVALLLIWAFIAFPLCLVGTVLSRNWAAARDTPCRVKRIPSPVPAGKWYQRPAAISLLSGLLPFGSIFIEMYFLFTSLWNHKVYFVYGFMLLVFMIMAMVTASSAIVGTYCLLNAENYHWHWTAFNSGMSTGLYVFLYAVHYFFFRTKMKGLFQIAFYFGYSAVFCIAVGITCGAIGYLAARSFVHKIYQSIKVD